MSGDLSQAKDLLESGAYTCVLCKGDRIYTTAKRGVLPLVEWVESGKVPEGFSAADKIVGRAAAFLYILLGIKEVYAPVMSEGALELFSQNGITAVCDTKTEAIINRKGTGICPMEQAVKDVCSPRDAFLAIKQTPELSGAVDHRD